ETTFEAMWRGIRAVRPGATLGDVGPAIQTYAESERFSVVREYCGHGIGKVYHDEPQVLHYGRPGEGLVLKPGMTFTIEPMINEGTRYTRVLPDGWTVVTKDRKLSAQWEHMVAVTEDGVDVLTLAEGQLPPACARPAWWTGLAPGLPATPTGPLPPVHSLPPPTRGWPAATAWMPTSTACWRCARGRSTCCCARPGHAACRTVPGWPCSPWAATAAASCSRARTSTCWCSARRRRNAPTRPRSPASSPCCGTSACRSAMPCVRRPGAPPPRPTRR